MSTANGIGQFQSSPKLSPGCDARSCRAQDVRRAVSILTQVVSWVRHGQECADDHHDTVSILTQVVSWVRHMPQCPPRPIHRVSILTQVVSWVRRAAYDLQSDSDWFQSSPKLSPGCDYAAASAAGTHATFQSSPKLSPGCDLGRRRRADTADVSILTQVVSWVRLATGVSRLSVRRFQSSPKLSPGCDPCHSMPQTTPTGFNPHPSCLLGATIVSSRLRVRM